MNERPSIAPGVLADVVDSVPSRLRKKLDRNPDAAHDWDWSHTNGQWTVQSSTATVTLLKHVIRSIEDVECSCLLSPRCFHVLATLSQLNLADAIDDTAAGDDSVAKEDSVPKCISAEIEGGDRLNVASTIAEALTDSQLRAARSISENGCHILSCGLRATGTLQQSKLLRAVHECRSEGLHRLAAAGIRVLSNVRRLRSNHDEFDSTQAETDLLELLEVSWRLIQRSERSTALVGIARRKYSPISNLKLHGLFCEPVLTRSGYSGVVTYLMSDDGWIGTVSDVQPGSADRIATAWQTGVSIAGLAMSHRDLSRSDLLISKATKSTDGRLGGADSARAIATKSEGWDSPVIAAAFEKPIDQQIEGAFQSQTIPLFERPAGTDLLFLQVEILGCEKTELIVRTTEDRLLKLSMALDTDVLAYRESLTMLARAPGLRLRCIVRLDFQRAGQAILLAVGPILNTSSETKPQGDSKPPELRFDDSLSLHAAVGLDTIQRSNLSKAERRPVEISVETPPSENVTEDVLSRWLRAIAVGGRHAVPTGTVTSAIRDAAQARRQMRPTAAAVLHRLTAAAIGTKTDSLGVRFPANATVLGEAWLAAAVAKRQTMTHLQQQAWLSSIGKE